LVKSLSQIQTFPATKAIECDEYRMAIIKYLVHSSLERFYIIYTCQLAGNPILKLALNLNLEIGQKLDYNLQYNNEDLNPDVCIEYHSNKY
jgi:hypothetical protein